MQSHIRSPKDGDARLKGKFVDSKVELPTCAEPERPSIWSYVKECIAVSPIGNLCIVSALIIGFYHGWLKRFNPGALSTFAYDIPLVIGLALAVTSLPARQSLFSSGRTAVALKFVLFLCCIYTLIPTDVPWLIRLASLRGWIFIPLMFVLGYRVISTPSQIFAFSTVIVVLCIAVTIYGALQDPADYINIQSEDVGLMKTINGSTYKKEGGGSGFRVFSTFVAPGAFSATMAFGIVIGVGHATEPRLAFYKRLFWIAGAGISLYGVFISGSRSSIITASLGTVAIIWMRGMLFKILLVLVPLAVIGSRFLADSETIDLERLLKAFSLTDIFSRAWIVVYPTFLALLEAPLGQGVGYSTHGVPIILYYLIPRYTPTLIDGEFGHAAVDIGLFGLVVYIAMIIRAVQDSVAWSKSLKGNASESDAIVTAALWIITVPSFVTGAPFLHVPTGAILWCYLGGLNRIYDEWFARKREEQYRNVKTQDIPFNAENLISHSLTPRVLNSPISSYEARDSSKARTSKKFLYRK